MSDDPQNLDKGAKRLQVLAHPVRLHICACLLEGSSTAVELAQQLNRDIPEVLEHLQVMNDAGFVQSEGAGAFGVYSFRPEVSLSALGIGDQATIDLGCCQLKLTQISDRKPEE